MLLGILSPPMALMYVGQLRWAGIYLLTALAVGAAGEFLLRGTIIAAAITVIFTITCAVHVYRLALRYPDERQRPAYSRWYGLLGTATELFLAAFGLRAGRSHYG